MPPSPSDVDLLDEFIQLVPRDFIEPIYEPRFVGAEEITWPDDTDVIGVTIGDSARAYPVSLLNSREMVVDTLHGVPILVTWCPVCATAMVHERMVNGEEIMFGTQGALYRNAMTWWDHDTGSIWSQPLGEAIAGPRRGETVELLPSEFTTWTSWRSAHPHTLALDVPAEPTGYDLGDLLIVVQLGDEVRGYPVSTLRDAGVVNDVVGGVEIAVVSDPTDADRWAVFSRQTGDAVVELVVEGDVLRDVDTGSAFDPVRGLGLDGKLAGVVLGQVPGATSLPGFGPTRTPVFLTIWPDATVWWP